MSKSETWTTIESDPGVFTQLTEQMGVTGVQFEELYTLDYQTLQKLRPVYGLIFLFKWRKEVDTRPIAEDTLGHVFFANQVITNACATQAILAVLLNSAGLELGPELSSFKDFTADFPPELKGLAISNSDSIREAHNSFARPESMVSDESSSGGREEDAFHFISYVPVAGMLYELDGLKPGPIALGPCSESDWLEKACPAIQERIERYAASEIRFNLMAMCQDRRVALGQQLAHATALRERGALRIAGGMQVDADASTTGPAATDADELPSDPDTLAVFMAHLDDEVARLGEEMHVEQQRRRDWNDENVRRRHNYIPLIFNLLKFMAERQQLQPLLEAARLIPPKAPADRMAE